jgi:hypothetical protein
MSKNQTDTIDELEYWIAYGNGNMGQGWYYAGYVADRWEDMKVPQRPAYGAIWVPNPNRPTFADWQFDGHDADGGYWIMPE